MWGTRSVAGASCSLGTGSEGATSPETTHPERRILRHRGRPPPPARQFWKIDLDVGAEVEVGYHYERFTATNSRIMGSHKHPSGEVGSIPFDVVFRT